jgi:hypothetical protein
MTASVVAPCSAPDKASVLIMLPIVLCAGMTMSTATASRPLHAPAAAASY